MEQELVVAVYLLVLAAFAGFEVITKVPPTLHTPLMSGANAISGIAVIGAILITTTSASVLVQVLGFFAIAAAMVNVVGGFMVTDRMLGMFRRRGDDR